MIASKEANNKGIGQVFDQACPIPLLLAIIPTVLGIPVGTAARGLRLCGIALATSMPS
ncbi:hypothetical protein AsAng_0012270 [Aureispira anguillae]|uniref:Uncharacterized protein n=1 Tax=Aureispira anguillae TaxID=2864201 RepID=A0A915YCG6_9BACT|nr:hypothetical protein AsAng_0012270 [Aureispira anguillae]